MSKKMKKREWRRSKRRRKALLFKYVQFQKVVAYIDKRSWGRRSRGNPEVTLSYYHHLLTSSGRVGWKLVLVAHLFTMWLIKCSHGQYFHQVLLMALVGSSGHPRYCEIQSQTGLPVTGLPVTWKHMIFCQWIYPYVDFLCHREVHMVWQLEFLLLQDQFYFLVFHEEKLDSHYATSFCPPLSPIACTRKPLLPNNRSRWNWSFTLQLSDTPVSETDVVKLASNTRPAIPNDICSRAKFNLSVTPCCFVSVQTPHLNYHLHLLPGHCFLGHLGQYFWDIPSHSLPACALFRCLQLPSSSVHTSALCHPCLTISIRKQFSFWTCCTAVIQNAAFENSP